MRISYWSSDVCSSGLRPGGHALQTGRRLPQSTCHERMCDRWHPVQAVLGHFSTLRGDATINRSTQSNEGSNPSRTRGLRRIGRESGRERVGHDGNNWGSAEQLKKKKKKKRKLH